MSIPPFHLLSDPDDGLPSLPPGRPRQKTPPKDVAAIYARAREPMMIERQFDQCEEYILDQGFILTESFHDISGAATIEGRPGLASMLKAAHRGEFGILVTDDVDRLIRDGAIADRIFAWTERHGIEIHTPNRGRMCRANVLMGGLMSYEARRIMGERIRHAMHRMVLDGLSPNAPCYGYAKVPGRSGEFVVTPRQAEQVERAFRMRLDGMSVNRIATVLEKRGPDRRPWTRDGISRLLRNPLYAGVLVHGRTRRTTDPLTGRPIVVARPLYEWATCLIAHLRIVESSTWHAVQASFRGPGASGIVPTTWPEAGGAGSRAAFRSGNAGETAQASAVSAAPCLPPSRQGS